MTTPITSVQQKTSSRADCISIKIHSHVKARKIQLNYPILYVVHLIFSLRTSFDSIEQFLASTQLFITNGLYFTQIQI